MKKVASVLLVWVMVLSFAGSAWAVQNINFARSSYKTGTRHNDVKIIQEALKKDGVLKIQTTTTYFGPATAKAVRDFQRKHKLKVDGVVGAGTLRRMESLGLFTTTQKPVNRGETVKKPISRGETQRRGGEYLDWWSEVSKMISNGDVLVIEDFETGKKFSVKVTAGTNHADVETLTKEDTAVMKSIWGEFSWDRRPVLVHVNDRIIAASMNGMPHAGVENEPAASFVSGRSAGFGFGFNYDFIKDNDMEGHVCLHFRNSLTHGSVKSDPAHQRNVRRAAGLN